jgi:surfeit locus 1 family protein
MTAFGVALGITLGLWQLQRLEWKEAIIAAVDARIHAPAVPLADALALTPADAEWRPVRAQGAFRHEDEVYQFAVGPEGQPGLHVVTPFETGSGLVLVDRGFVPEALRDPATRADGQAEGTVVVEGLLRARQETNLFTPQPDLGLRTWYARDPAAMAEFLGISLLAPVVIEAGPAPNPGGWPLGGQTLVSFPNNHLQYAVTWFGLALALLAVYLVYLWRQPRRASGA